MSEKWQGLAECRGLYVRALYVDEDGQTMCLVMADMGLSDEEPTAESIWIDQADAVRIGRIAEGMA